MWCSVCIELFTNVSQSDPQIANAFFQQYYIGILQDIFFVLTDAEHKAGACWVFLLAQSL